MKTLDDYNNLKILKDLNLVNQGILIGIVVGVFFAGIGIGYGALQSTTTIPMMMGNNMMDSSMMMNHGITSSQSSQTLPTNESTQTRTFQISMEEVEFFAEAENEEGVEGISFVELHRWEPNMIIVNQGDTVVLEITNPRKNAHTFSVPEFGVNSQVLEPRIGTDTVTFVADTAGVFTFSCGLPYNPDKLYCDPDHSMMTGTLIVLE